jgi:hypothetical protein
MASAHLQTDRFIRVWDSIRKNDLQTALLRPPMTGISEAYKSVPDNFLSLFE